MEKKKESTRVELSIQGHRYRYINIRSLAVDRYIQGCIIFLLAANRYRLVSFHFVPFRSIFLVTIRNVWGGIFLLLLSTLILPETYEGEKGGLVSYYESHLDVYYLFEKIERRFLFFFSFSSNLTSNVNGFLRYVTRYNSLSLSKLSRNASREKLYSQNLLSFNVLLPFYLTVPLKLSPRKINFRIRRKSTRQREQGGSGEGGG